MAFGLREGMKIGVSVEGKDETAAVEAIHKFYLVLNDKIQRLFKFRRINLMENNEVVDGALNASEAVRKEGNKEACCKKTTKKKQQKRKLLKKINEQKRVNCKNTNKRS